MLLKNVDGITQCLHPIRLDGDKDSFNIAAEIPDQTTSHWHIVWVFAQ
jgi:hypothetical protein